MVERERFECRGKERHSPLKRNQPLNTKSHKAKIMKISKDSKMPTLQENALKKRTFTIQLSVLAETECTGRYNDVAEVLQRNVCEKYGIKT